MFIFLFDVFAEQYHCTSVIQEGRLNPALFKELIQLKLANKHRQCLALKVFTNNLNSMGYKSLFPLASSSMDICGLMLRGSDSASVVNALKLLFFFLYFGIFVIQEMYQNLDKSVELVVFCDILFPCKYKEIRDLYLGHRCVSLCVYISMYVYMR